MFWEKQRRRSEGDDRDRRRRHLDEKFGASAGVGRDARRGTTSPSRRDARDASAPVIEQRLDSALAGALRERTRPVDAVRRDRERCHKPPRDPRRDPMRPEIFPARAVPFVLRELQKFVCDPAPSGGGVVIRCFIERTRSGRHALFPVYKLYADHEDGTGRLLMAARKMPSSGPSTYAFSTAPEDLFKKSANRSRHFLGKLHAFSSATTEYVLVDAGAKPLEGARRAAPDARRELAAICFAGRSRGAENPRRIEVALPAVHWRPRDPVTDPTAEKGCLEPGVVSCYAFRPLEDQDGIRHALTIAQSQGSQNVLHRDKVAVLHATHDRVSHAI